MKALLYQLDAMSLRVIVGVMEQQRYRPVPAASRSEALKAIQSERVDVMVVDTQKDGLDLIRAIRAEARGAGARLPVIALAIVDTPGNRQRCAEAGADAVLPIPVRAPELLAALDQAVGLQNASTSPTQSKIHGTRPAVDIAAALERVEGDRALLEELLRLFVDECQNTLRQIRDVWASRDARALGRLAHALKGSAANIGADGVSEAAFALERLARSGNLENAVRYIADLEGQTERLTPELDSFLKEAAQ